MINKLTNRRSFLIGLITAPVIIRAGILMPIKVIEPIKTFTLEDYENLMNKMIKNFQNKLAKDIFDTSNRLDALKFYVQSDDLRVEPVDIYREWLEW